MSAWARTSAAFGETDAPTAGVLQMAVGFGLRGATVRRVDDAFMAAVRGWDRDDTPHTQPTLAALKGTRGELLVLLKKTL